MAIKYNPLLEGFWYTPKDQKGTDNPFKVKLQLIKSTELVKLQDGLLQRSANDSISLKTGTYSASVCKASVIDWSGVQDLNDKDISCKLDQSGSISNNSLDCIPAHYFEEISQVASTVSQDPSSLQLFKDDE